MDLAPKPSVVEWEEHWFGSQEKEVLAVVLLPATSMTANSLQLWSWDFISKWNKLDDFSWTSVSKCLWISYQNLLNSCGYWIVQVMLPLHSELWLGLSLTLTPGAPKRPSWKSVTKVGNRKGWEIPLSLGKWQRLLLNIPNLRFPDLASVSYLLFIWNII